MPIKVTTTSQDHLLQDITKPGAHDVLYGRGGMTNSHAGNVRFRQLINENKIRYLKATKVKKPEVAREVVSMWRNMSPPGRFLAMSRTNGTLSSDPIVWHDVGDVKARMKVSQCLRERTPDVMPIVQSLQEKKMESLKDDKLSTEKEETQNETSCDESSLQGEAQPVHSQGIRSLPQQTPLGIPNLQQLTCFADKTTAELRVRQFQVLKRIQALQEQQRRMMFSTLSSQRQLQTQEPLIQICHGSSCA